MKACILFSGGLDSTTLLALAIEQYDASEVTTLSVTYGQKHGFAEMGAAARLAHHYGVERQTVALNIPFARSSLLLGHGGAMSGPATVIPGRNALLLSLAACYAESVGAEEVWFGGHLGDRDTYPDCRTEFVEALGLALWRGGSPVRLVQPFRCLEKAEVVAEARRLGVPLELTWSCYQPRVLQGLGCDCGEVRQVPCGECGACIERNLALAGL